MEIAGDLFKPFFGLVNQTTFAPVGRLIPWKMSKATLNFEVNEVDTDNNAVPDFSTAIGVKRKLTGTISQASFDPTFSLFGANPFGLPFAVREGMYIRALMVPAFLVAGPLGIGDIRGVPITGAVGELLAATPAASHVFLSLLLTKVRQEPDAGAGQPVDMEFRSVMPYSTISESAAIITLYGYSGTVGAGGFL